VQDDSESGGGGYSVSIAAPSVLDDVHLGDSIAVNGCCLTVTEYGEERKTFKVGVSPETLRRTNLEKLVKGSGVNLERAVSGHIRFGGHFVQGHVDCTASIVERKVDGNSIWFLFRLNDPSLVKYIVEKGFIALDGTSLTVTEVNDADATFGVMIIAYTQSKVVMTEKKEGDTINVEVDMIGKYVEKQVAAQLAAKIPLTPHMQ